MGPPGQGERVLTYSTCTCTCMYMYIYVHVHCTIYFKREYIDWKIGMKTKASMVTIASVPGLFRARVIYALQMFASQA